MVQNYLKTAWRFFWKNKFFSIINLFGLAIGISASLVIFLIVFYEFNFDRFEKDRERIFRVVMDAEFNGVKGYSAGVPSPLGPAISKELPDLDQVVPVFQFPGNSLADVQISNDINGTRAVYKKQKDIILTNGEYLKLLNFHWLAGNDTLQLKSPFTVVLTESRAMQYFPHLERMSILGKSISYNGINATVTGIVKDLNHQTDFNAKEFISVSTIDRSALKDNFMTDVWGDWMINSQLLLKLSKGSNEKEVVNNINKLYNAHFDQTKQPTNKIAFALQPLSTIHFDGRYPGVNSRIANKPTLFILLAAAAFLLLLGCINFVNLFTAQSLQRRKEIGIRRIMGSSRVHLILLVLIETFLITLGAVVLSFVAMPLLLKLFDSYIPLGLNAGLLMHPMVLLFLLMLWILISILASIYPAIILCRTEPVLALKKIIPVQNHSPVLEVRKTLTVFQFVIAQFFVIATLIVARQVHYSLNSDMGFNKQAVIKIDIPENDKLLSGGHLVNQIKVIPGVNTASLGFFSPADEGAAYVNIAYQNGKEILRPQTQLRWGDSNYQKVYDLKIVAGRMVSTNDSLNEFVVNEKLTKEMGFSHSDEAVGKYLRWNDNELVPIVGVMKDFHDQSFKAQISPMIFKNGNGTTLHIRLVDTKTKGEWVRTIAQIEKLYRANYPGQDFRYTFVDETVAGFYKEEQSAEGLMWWVTILSIIVSSLGLLGLVIYTTTSRTKEIGIRKVLGASANNIVLLLSKEFVFLVLLAFLISTPFAWWAAHAWLQNYAFKTSVSWWIFLTGGSIMLLIAILTLGIRVLQVALANPTKALRNE